MDKGKDLLDKNQTESSTVDAALALLRSRISPDKGNRLRESR